MAHELENSKSMVYVGETPWHGLGIQISDDLSTDEVLRKAGLDWTVEKFPLFAEVNGTKIATDRHALFRSSDNRFLDVVGEGWNPVQNKEAFDFFCEFVNAGDMSMHTAGSLKGGKHVWALAKLKDSFFEVFGNDRTEGYLLFSNPHIFGKSIQVQFTPVRVVCNNTLTWALDSARANSMFRSSHHGTFDAEAVKDALGIATSYMEKYKEQVQFLGSKQYKDENIVEYFNRVFPMTGTGEVKTEELGSRAAKNAFALLETQPGAEYAPGTFWQLFNAVTFTTDHVAGRTQDGRLTSAWFGVNRERKNKAFNLALEMAQAA